MYNCKSICPLCLCEAGPGAGERSAADAPSEKPNKRRQRKLQKNQPAFDLAAELQRTMGVDMTAIDGVDVMTTQVILSELGPDLSFVFSERKPLHFLVGTGAAAGRQRGESPPTEVPKEQQSGGQCPPLGSAVAMEKR